ncbi:hypothetical protein HanPI659440_Chr14g0564331 [Helianthus annuus]|nr:hypothetical protein HanPI659440_Chr14g0564331 [Helianthus annuus]
MIAHLDPEGKFVDFKEITQWIRESRINKAVTFSMLVYKTLVKAFWDTAQLIEVDGKEMIRGQVHKLNVDVTPEILNTVLELQDVADAPFSIPIKCTRGCLLRMKCTADIFAGQINKASLPMRYKFLLHVLIQCLGKNRAGGYDMTGFDLIGLMVALVLNKPFSISKLLFAYMKDNLQRTRSRTTGKKFWIYPRFVQMVMNTQHPDLPKADTDILKIETMLAHSFNLFKGHSAKKYKESDPPRKMFGALANKAYVAPDDDKWRHNDSQSDDEEPELTKRMKEKLKRKRDSTDSSDSDDDEEGGDGDGGNAEATAASAPGASNAGGDEQEDADYVPSDTEGERVQKKKKAVPRKKKAKRNIGTSSSTLQSVPSEPIQEASMDPNFGFTAEEASTMASSPPRSTEQPSTTIQPPPVVSSTPETPTVISQAVPQRSMAAAIRATTSQPSDERQRIFSEYSQEEKNNFLFSQLEAAADRIQRQTEFIMITKNDQVSQLVEIDKLKSTVDQQQTVIERQQAEIDSLKAENARLKAAEEERERNNTILQTRVAALWDYHCKQQEVLKKRDDDSEDQGNPDTSGTSQKQPAATSSAVIVVQPSVVESIQGTSYGTAQQVEGTVSVPSSADIALQAIHPVTGELLEEGELIEDFSHEQLLALQAMRKIDDAEIERMPSEPDSTDVENVEEIVFEGNEQKSAYVRKDGTEFPQFDEDWLKENVEVIDEHLKNRDTSENPGDAFTTWRQQFLSRVSKPVQEATQVEYLRLEKAKPNGRILCWMFVKEIHCVAIKWEFGIQYFRSLLSILSLPFYDMAALTKLDLINHPNFDGATLFERLIRMNKKTG